MVRADLFVAQAVGSQISTRRTCARRATSAPSSLRSPPPQTQPSSAVATTTPSTLLSPSSTTPNVRYKASCVLRATWPLRCAPRRSAKRRAYTPTSKAGYLRTKMSALSQSGRRTHAWCAVVRDTHPRVCLFASTPFKHSQHSLQCPDVDTADPDVVSRLDARSKISY